MDFYIHNIINVKTIIGCDQCNQYELEQIKLLSYCFIFSALNPSEEHSDLLLLQALQVVTDLEDEKISLFVQNEMSFWN